MNITDCDTPQRISLSEALKKMSDSVTQSLMLIDEASRQEAIASKKQIQEAFFEHYIWTEEKIKSALEESSQRSIEFSVVKTIDEATKSMEEKVEMVLDTVRANYFTTQEIMKGTVDDIIRENDRRISKNSADIMALEEKVRDFFETAQNLNASTEKRIQEAVKESLTEIERLSVARSVEESSKALEDKISKMFQDHSASSEKQIQVSVQDVMREIDQRTSKNTEDIKALEEKTEKGLELTRGHYTSSEERIQETVRKALREYEREIVKKSVEEATKIINEKVEKVSAVFKSDYSLLEKKMQGHVQKSLRDLEKRAVSKSVEEASKNLKTKVDESLKVVRNNYSTLENRIQENVQKVLKESEERTEAKSIEGGCKIIEEKLEKALSVVRHRNTLWEEIIKNDMKEEFRESEERMTTRCVEECIKALETTIKMEFQHFASGDQIKDCVQKIVRDTEQYIVARTIDSSRETIEEKMEEKFFKPKNVSTGVKKPLFLRRNMGRFVNEIFREFNRKTLSIELEEATKLIKKKVEEELDELRNLMETLDERLRQMEEIAMAQKSIQDLQKDNHMNPVATLLDKRLRSVEIDILTTNNRIIPTVSALLELISKNSPGKFDELRAIHSAQYSSDSRPSSSAFHSPSKSNRSKKNVLSEPVASTSSASTDAGSMMEVIFRQKHGELLMEAVESGDKELVKKLVEDGASVNYKVEDGRTPLHIAAAQSDGVVLFYLLARGALPNAITSSGCTPLHLAATYDHKNNCVDLLIAAGADLHCLDNEGRTALHLAAGTGNTSAVESLIAQGVRKDIKDKQGRTPFDLAREKMFKARLRPKPNLPKPSE